MKLTLTVCNICQDKERPTTRYEIKQDGRKVTPDLCEEHAAPLEAFLAESAPGPRRPAKKASGSRRGRVMTLEEIEAQKKAGKV